MLALLAASLFASDVPPSFDLKAAQKALAAPKVTRPVALKATADFVQVLTHAPGTRELSAFASVVAQLRTKAGLDVDPTPLRERAQKQYQARNFGLACRSFQAAVDQGPTTAELWADLGLCAFKLGQVERGAQASRAAIALGEATVRKSAYFNLGKFSPIDASSDAEGCDEHYEVRNVSWSRTGCDAHYCYEGHVSWALLGRTAEEVDACSEALTAGLQQEEAENRTSARAIGSTTSTACTSTTLADTVRTTGGYEGSESSGSDDGARCRFVYVDACRRLVGVACEGGEVVELTP
jgi:tetratricopeptide (TPR) repeat protein